MSDSIEGLWWIDWAASDPVRGVLEATTDGIRLRITLAVAAPSEKAFFDLIMVNQDYECAGTIYGKDEHGNHVTLLSCFVTNRNLTMGFRRYVIQALTMVHGLRLDSGGHAILRAVMLRPQALHRWIDRQFRDTIRSEDGRVGITLSQPMEVLVPVEPGVQFRIAESCRGHSSSEETSFSPDSQVWLHFEEPRSLNEICDTWIPWVLRLFSILIGKRIQSEETTVFTRGPYTQPTIFPQEEGKLRGSGAGLAQEEAPDLFGRDMLAPYKDVRDRLASIILEWHRLQREQRAVLDLFTAAALSRSLYRDAAFLFLVQALEVYHTSSRRFISKDLPPAQHAQWVEETLAQLPAERTEWARGKLSLNSKSLSKKLDELFQAHGDVARELFGDSEGMAARIAHTRNSITHHQTKRDSKKLLDGKEMAETSWSLEAFLWILLLEEMTLGGAPAQRLIARVKGTAFVIRSS